MSRSKYDPDIDSIRRPLRSPSSPSIMSNNPIAPLRLQLPSKLKPKKKERPTFTIEPFSSSTDSSYIPSYGEFLESCLFCEKQYEKEDNFYMYRDFKSFCSKECQSKYTKLIQKEEEDPYLPFSDAFIDIDLTKQKRLGHQQCKVIREQEKS